MSPNWEHRLLFVSASRPSEAVATSERRPLRPQGVSSDQLGAELRQDARPWLPEQRHGRGLPVPQHLRACHGAYCLPVPQPLSVRVCFCLYLQHLVCVCQGVFLSVHQHHVCVCQGMLCQYLNIYVPVTVPTACLYLNLCLLWCVSACTFNISCVSVRVCFCQYISITCVSVRVCSVSTSTSTCLLPACTSTSVWYGVFLPVPSTSRVCLSGCVSVSTSACRACQGAYCQYVSISCVSVGVCSVSTSTSMCLSRCVLLVPQHLVRVC